MDYSNSNGYTNGSHSHRNHHNHYNGNGYVNGNSNGIVETCSQKVNGDHKEETDFQPIIKPGRFVGRGRYDQLIHLCTETGYLIWVEPRGELQVKFTYGETGCDFLCYIEPEVDGVSITQLDSLPVSLSSRPHLNFNANPFHSGLAASSAGSTSTRHSCAKSLLNPYSYAVDSSNGQCNLLLRPVGANDSKHSSLTNGSVKNVSSVGRRPFKLNFQLVL